MPLLGLAAVLGWNYANHKRHRSTMCGVTRRVLPPAGFLTAWALLTAWMVRHILRGYPT